MIIFHSDQFLEIAHARWNNLMLPLGRDILDSTKCMLGIIDLTVRSLTDFSVKQFRTGADKTIQPAFVFIERYQVLMLDDLNGPPKLRLIIYSD
jgi:hypothetical protein